MLKTFLSSLSGSSGETPNQATPPDIQDTLDLERLKLIVETFPIGKKLRYTPDFKHEIVFDTLLVAYCIDGEFAYSRESVEFDSKGYPAAFILGTQGKRVTVNEVKLFQLLLPDTSDQEKTLDYTRRAIIGREYQFSKGKYILLISSLGGRGVTTMETEVVKRVVLKEGPYASANMVLVAPDLESITHVDQRGKTRTKICVPVTVTVADGQLQDTCKMVDFSDTVVRIRVPANESGPQLHKGDEVILGLNFGDPEMYMIKGSVTRRSADAFVIKLDAFSKGGPFLSFGSLDQVELKAELLNYGN